MLSTIHTAEIVRIEKKDHSGENVRKLKVIHHYNQKIDRVYKNDAMVGNYSCI